MNNTIKKLLILITALSLVTGSVGISLADSAVDTIMRAGTTQAFTDQQVSDADIETILNAGLIAASAINQQPWYFVAVTNGDVMQQINSSSAPMAMPAGAAPAGAPEGAPAGAPAAMPAPAASGAKASLGDSPLAIIIFKDNATKSPNADFDCGLAAQNMYIAAASLGYGVKIVSSTTRALNGDNHEALCNLLGVDPAMEAVAVLLIGQPDTDATSTATTRSALSEKTTVVK